MARTMTAPIRCLYRLQLTPQFPFARAAEVLEHLASLGVSHVYLSPILEARPGSAHGYDVTDPRRVRAELGGAAGFRAFAAACRARGLGLVLDVVPNHAAATPENPCFRDLMERGAASEFARWFDVDWDETGGVLVLPWLERAEDGGGDGPHFRRVAWREAGRLVNWRRYLDFGELIALRVEDPAVRAATHARVDEWIADGTLDGVRIDHADGLAEPAAYFRALAALPRPPDRGPLSIIAEKCLEPGADPPPDWPVDGTVGYDFLNAVTRLLVDADGLALLERAYERFTGAPWRAPRGDVLRKSAEEQFGAELHRLVARALRLGAAAGGERAEVGAALLGALAALPTGRPRAAAAHLPGLAGALLEDAGFARRFEEFALLVAARGLEDTHLWRDVPCPALCELGGDPRPAAAALGAGAFHAFAAHRAERGRASWNAWSTHDSRWSGDARARLLAITHHAAEFAEAVPRWSAWNEGLRRSGDGPRWHDANAEWLLLHALFATWPARADELPEFRRRFTAFAVKAAREAKVATAWARIDAEYEAALVRFAEGLVDGADPRFAAERDRFAQRIAASGSELARSAAVLLCTAPGVPALYQGEEDERFDLVDPDNRQPVAIGAAAPAGEKRALLRTLLQWRVAGGAPFASGTYQPLAVLAEDGGAAPAALAFQRRSGDRAAVIAVSVRPGAAGRVRVPLLAGLPGQLRDVLRGGGVRASGDGLRLDLPAVLAAHP